METQDGPSAASQTRSPLRFRLLPRPRVSALVHEALSERIALLIAGPGAGKSIAVSQALADITLPYVRCSASTGDDLFTFATLLAQTVSPRTPGILSTIEGACAEARKAADPVAQMAYWLSAHLESFEGLIVIEDLHHAWSTDKRASTLLARLVDETTNAVQFLITARTQCALPIDSWITYGMAAMPIYQDDLAYTSQELKALAHLVGAQPSEVESIISLTEGWPAAATFALMTTARRSGNSLEMATRDMMYGFLAEQVLAGLSASDVDFMLDTCVFTTLDADVLRSAGFPNARTTIESLRGRVPFLQFASNNAYKYHDLFRDFLLTRLQGDDDRFRNAWMRAGTAYENCGDFDSALDAYRMIDEKNSVFRLLHAHGIAIAERGRIDAVWNALQSLGTEATDGTLLGLRASCSAARGDFSRSDVLFERALEMVEEPLERAQLSLRYASGLFNRDPARVVAVLDEYDAETPHDDRLAALILSALALGAFICGDETRGNRIMYRALNIGANVDDPYAWGLVQHRAGTLAFRAGDLASAERTMNLALEIAQANNLHHIVSRVLSQLYNMSVDRDDMAAALSLLGHLERSAALSGETIFTFFAIAGEYDAQVDSWNVPAIEHLDTRLRKYESLVIHWKTEAVAPALAMRAAIAGDFAEAYAILEGTAPLQLTAQRRALRHAESSLYAAAAGRSAEAERSFMSARTSLAERSQEPSVKRVARTHATLALTALLLRRERSAEKHLRELDRCSPKVGPRFIALARALRALYITARTHLLREDLDAKLDSLSGLGFGGVSRLIRALPLASAATEPLSALTNAELRLVLALTDTTGTESLANTLKMSPNTVKFHLKAINRKLGCRSREEVAQLARREGLTTPA